MKTDRANILPFPNSAGARQRQTEQLATDIARFRETWPPLTAGGSPLPAATWEEMERQLLQLCPPHMTDLTTGWLSATRKLAPYKPPEMVMREILCFAAVVLTEEDSGEEGSMS